MYENFNRDLLIERIKELEEQVSYLRISRRVLMNLIEKIETEKRFILNKLEEENKKLHKNNIRYAKKLWNKNKKIIELEINLSKQDGGI